MSSKFAVTAVGAIGLITAYVFMTTINHEQEEAKANDKVKTHGWTPPPAKHRFSGSSCSIRRLTAVEAKKISAEQLINASEPVIVPLERYWQQAAKNWSMEQLFVRARSTNGGGDVKVGNRSNIVKKQGASEAVSMSLLEYLTKMSVIQENLRANVHVSSNNLVLFDQVSFCIHHHALCQRHAIPKDWQKLINTANSAGQLAVRTFVSIGEVQTVENWMPLIFAYCTVIPCSISWTLYHVKQPQALTTPAWASTLIAMQYSHYYTGTKFSSRTLLSASSRPSCEKSTRDVWSRFDEWGRVGRDHIH